MTKAVEPTDIGKHPDIIKKAQEEIFQMDVLVCGKCHSVFHFMEEFMPHKNSNCKGASTMKDCKETKPLIWAFLLWKNAQPDSPANMWKLYQTWARMSDGLREGWISAGRTLQSFSRVTQGTLQEKKFAVEAKLPVSIKAENLATSRMANRGVETRLNTPSPGVKKENDIERKIIVKGTPLKAVPRGVFIGKRTIKTTPSTIEVTDCLVEKIMAKRQNSGTKNEIYLVKWANMDSDQNSWEPLSHLEKCGPLIENLERQLKGKGMDLNSPDANRPARNSKVKALDQVKQWCADEDGIGGVASELKRKNTDSDYAGGDSSQDEALGSPTPKKQLRIESMSVQQAVIRAGQTGNVKIFQTTAKAPIKSPINGAALATRTKEKNSAEVVITTAKDKQTGVMRKPGSVTSLQPKKEATIKVVAKNDSTSSGIVKIGATSPKVMPKLVQTITPRLMTTPAPGLRSIPQPQQSQMMMKPVTKSSLAQRAAQQQQLQQQNAARASPAQQQVVRRQVVATPQKQTTTQMPARLVRSAPNSKASTPVSQQVTRRSAASASLNPPSLTKIDLRPPLSPPRPLTLCPITGKVLSRAEGEPELLSPKKEDSKKNAPMQIAGIQTEDGQIQQIITNEDGSPLLVTGEDGTIYQVAGKTADGQTLLIAQGADGEQHCVYVAAEDGDESGLLALTQSATQQSGESQEAESSSQYGMSQDEDSLMAGGDMGQQVHQEALSVDTDSQDGQITAELVQADQPSPGGTRRVVLLLPDGNLMVTEVNKEQYDQFTMGG